MRFPTRAALPRLVPAGVAAILIAGACARAAVGPHSAEVCCASAARGIAEGSRVSAISKRRFTHAELWAALDTFSRSPSLRVAEVGRSTQGRPIRAVTYGDGPTTVLLWSQMHGDESTATMALADIIAWLSRSYLARDPLRARIAAELTVVMVPMLNPDGAEVFQRENAMGVDINRDARRLSTPEGRALKALRDSLRPEFGFNLHDQSARTLTSPGDKQVAIALLAPAADVNRNYGPVRARARLVAAGIASVLAPEIPERLAVYDDAFNPRAFGDLMQTWGTSTVLIESGAMPDDPEKQQLRALNVIAIVSALEMIATGRFREMDPAVYEALPRNGRSAVDILIRGAQLVLPGNQPMLVDVALNYDEPVAKRDLKLREVGDLAAVIAIDTIDASGLFLHPAQAMVTGSGVAMTLRIGAPASFTLERGRNPGSQPVWLFGLGR